MIDLADDNYALDISRAQEVLGWNPPRPLRKILAKMIEFLKADPAGFYRENKLDPLSDVRSKPADSESEVAHDG